MISSVCTQVTFAFMFIVSTPMMFQKTCFSFRIELIHIYFRVSSISNMHFTLANLFIRKCKICNIYNMSLSVYLYLNIKVYNTYIGFSSYEMYNNIIKERIETKYINTYIYNLTYKIMNKP